MNGEIREARKKRGLTLEQVSEATGIGIPSLSRIETGSQPVTAEQLKSITEVIDAPELLASFCASCPVRGPICEAKP